VQQDLENNFRAVLRSSLTKLDLVSRDEFDAQMRVLERTRARLEELERKVAAMEGSGVGGPPTVGGEPGPH
jgi:BMFP domain-containing protein YqiC